MHTVDPEFVVQMRARRQPGLANVADYISLTYAATVFLAFAKIVHMTIEGGDITAGYVAQTSLVVVGGSAVLGVLIGYIGLAAMKTTDNRVAELLILILTGYGAFEISEHFYVILNIFGGHSHMHLSGILACIFSTVTVHHVLSKSIEDDDKKLEDEEAKLDKESGSAQTSLTLIHSVVAKIKATVEERDRHMRTKEDVQLLAIVANTMLFVAMAEIIDLKLLWHYKTEILVMFLATTVIRAAMMAKFAFLTNQTDKMTNVNFRWWGVLTFAGIKGGLSIVMLMMIPSTFEHLEMFKAIVVGVIMLSTFIYSFILLGIIGKNRAIFAQELEDEGGHH